jgi:hypothetical protein
MHESHRMLLLFRTRVHIKHLAVILTRHVSVVLFAEGEEETVLVGCDVLFPVVAFVLDFGGLCCCVGADVVYFGVLFNFHDC